MFKGTQLLLASFVLVFCGLAASNSALAATPGGTRIINIATATSSLSGTTVSNPAIVIVRSTARLDMLRYAPDVATAPSYTLEATEYSSDASESGSFTPIDDVLATLGNPLPLVKNDTFPAGSVVFFRLDDPDQNLDPSLVESVFLTITVASSNDLEFVRIYETGPDTGVFIGYLPSVSRPAGTQADGRLQAPSNSLIETSYVDAADGNDAQTQSALFDPLGRAFDSVTGALLDAVEITLLDAATGSPANVFGNGTDGTGQPCTYPATVVTGRLVVDSCGVSYPMPPGGYQFPRVASGSYRIEVNAAPGYTAPSQVPFDQLQSLPNAPWDLQSPGSTGGTFAVNPGPAFRLDIPLDPAPGRLWLSKTADRTIASTGDFLLYTLLLENLQDGSVTGVTIDDRLPLGFRYQDGSAQVDGSAVKDPQISDDGRTLTFAVGDLPAQSRLRLTYVLEVAAGVQPGKAINQAMALADRGVASNRSSATVEIVNPFFTDKVFLTGRVFEGSCSEPDHLKEGLADARIYLEDGTYVITDRNGRFHMEGVEPGVHVVQLDLDSLPEGYEALPCASNSQFAGRAFSQFIDLQGGTLWRTDFHVKPKPPQTGEVRLSLDGTVEDLSIRYRLPIQISGLPLHNARLTVTIPDGTTFQPGTAELDEQAIEPVEAGRTMTFDLGDLEADSRHSVTLRVTTDHSGSGELLAKASLAFTPPGGENRDTPQVEHRILREARDDRVALPEMIVRPRFASFSTDLSDEDLQELQNIADLLAGAELVRIDATGHADNLEIAERSRHIHTDNQTLSEARAETVIRTLGEMLQLPPSKITISGQGSRQPVASNDSEDGRALNRRVELAITAQQVQRHEKLVALSEAAPATLAVQAQTATQRDTLPAQPEDTGRSKPLQGITTPEDGARLAHPVNAVRIEFDARLTPRLSLDGLEIPADAIAFTKTDPQTGTTIQTYTGVDFGGPGQHVLRLQGIDPFDNARLDQTVTVIRTGDIGGITFVSSGENLADGVTPLQVKLRVEDQNGETIAAPLNMQLREGSLRPPDHPEEVRGYDDADNENLVTVDAEGIVRFAPVDRAGRYDAVLVYDTFEVDIETWVTPKMRDWILVGFAEGTAGYNTFSGNRVSLEEAGLDEHYYDDGEVKFFAKGAIKGEWLLTMAYDSDKPDLDGDSLQQIIDPDTYYPLYGDGTRQDYEAASARDVYVKLEREQFYALFGDMQTGLTETELSRYSRSMNGVKSELQSEHFSYTLFAADTKQAFAMDEIRGDGTSGRYYLSQKDLVINSEEITLETRDRFRSEIVLETRTLQRHMDYDIDYDAGSLFFKQPVPSKDAAFNPVYIVVRYETRDADNENFNYGGRAAIQLLEGKLEVGASYVHEASGAGEGDLYGADTTIKLAPNTTLRMEAATTDTEDYGNDQRGDAYLVELEHQGMRLKARTYFREQEEDFGLGQQSVTETGTRKYGAEARYHFTTKFSLAGLAYHEDNLTTGDQRDVAELDARYQADRYSLHSGLRYAKDRLDGGGSYLSEQLLFGGQWLTANRKLTVRADHEQSLRDRNENSDYPTRTTLGLDYQINSRISTFAEQELTWGNQEDTESTRVGIKTRPWQGAEVRNSLERQMNENGQRVFALFGLSQSWKVNQNLSIDTSLDRSYTIKSNQVYRFNTNVPPAQGGDDDFTSVSVGATYQKALWTWESRLETRQAVSEDKYGASTSIVAEPREGIAVAAKALAFMTRISGGSERTDGNIRLGMAYRPTASPWILLERLDFYFDQLDNSAKDYDNWRIVNNLHANYRLSRAWQVSFYHGLKYTRDSYASGSYSGVTDTVAVETRYHIDKHWDVGAHSSALHSWNSHNFEYGVGADIGYSPATNMWISVGYNFAGFEDKDFSAADYSAEGPYVRFRVKFDQQSVRSAAEWLNR